jgi:hypothetical protein
MTNTKDAKAGPVEVWLSQVNIEVTCMIVREDESTTNLDIGALSMRGAQREITGYLVSRGYAGVDRWEATVDDGASGAIETTRRFKPTEAVQVPI